MMKPSLKFHSTLLLLVVSCSLAAQEPARIRVMDQGGNTLAGVVIEIKRDSVNVVSGPADISRQSGADDGQTGHLMTMDQVSKRFVPELLVISAGEKVLFPNSDDIRHHVYSFSPAKTFELKLYSGIPESPVAFDNPGVVILGCNIHDSMVGYIYVAESEAVYVSDESGLIEPVFVDKNDVMSAWFSLQDATPESRQTFTLEELDQEESGIYLLSLATVKPAPRNTFQDQFRGPVQE